MLRTRITIGCALLLASACTDSGSGASEPLLIGAAASLDPVLTQVAEDFTQATGLEVIVTYGASGSLAQQLREGAPIDVFLPAEAAYVARILDAGVGDPGSQRTYASGRLVIWSPEQAWGGWPDLEALVADPQVRLIAIADPDVAPYGRAARQALERAGLWDAVADRLVYGQNVADAQRLAASRNADVALVALSLARTADAGAGGRWVLVDEAGHDPLLQDVVITTSDPARTAIAQRFVDHLLSEDGRSVLRRFGLLQPAETQPTVTG
jgi:molybdate transport system substrate-binding protein